MTQMNEKTKNKKIYRKKIISTDEKSSSDARGKRLRKIRNLANISREQLASHCGTCHHTVKRWELGYFGGLPLDGAQAVVERVSQEGVICSLDWLLYEIGTGPQVLPDFDKIKKIGSPFSLKQTIDDKNIIEEMLLFRNHYKNTIEHKIEDDGLSPYFNIGDHVAGIEYAGEKINSFINENVIIRLNNGGILVRNLREGKTPGTYTLVCTNINTTVDTPIIYDATIMSAGQILRHYVRIKS